MAREVVVMDVRLRIAVAGEGLNVSEFCREQRISRQTFYQWRRRYLAEGLDGLEPRSRAPRTSPNRIDAAVEEAIVGLRKELTERGLDAGPGTIQWHLGRQGRRSVPSEATIWRILVRRGFVVPEPASGPRAPTAVSRRPPRTSCGRPTTSTGWSPPGRSGSSVS